MPIVSRLAAMTSRAWGQFKTAAAGLVGNYLYTWGSNTNSRLGIGLVTATVNRSSPVAVALRKTFTDFDAASGVAAIDTTGAMWGWGNNSSGQVGDGSTLQRSSPVQIGTLTNWSKVSKGTNTTLSVKTDGTLWSWGLNNVGQLGDGTTVNKSSPVQVGTLTGWAYVAGDNVSLSIKTDGTLWAWGLNSVGQMGDGTTVNKSSPVQIGTLTNWAQVSGTGAASGAVKTDGTLWMWGNGASGALGNGGTTNRSSPIQVGTLTNWSKVYSGAYSCAVAIKTDGTLWAWGNNANGTLGDGTTVNKSSPIQIGTLTTWSKVYLKALSVIALKNDGTVWVWGLNSSGQLGLNDTTNRSSPVQIGLLNNYTDVKIGETLSIFTSSDGYNWSSGPAAVIGQVGATNFSTPQVVDLGTRKYASVAGLSTAMVAVSNDKKLWGWGANNVGQVGDGTTIERSLPTQVGTLTNWKSVYANGASTASAIKTNGSLWTWGSNSNGELGNNTWGTANQVLRIPTQFTNLQYSDVSYGTGGLYVSGGALYACGNNLNYQLGDGTTVWKSSPVQIGTQTNWSKVSAGKDFSLAIKTDGTLWAWGNNAGYIQGPFATNLANTTAYSSPIQIALSYGTLGNSGYSRYATHALTQEGYLVGWGRNPNYQVGNNSTTGDISGPIIIDTNVWSSVSDGSSTSMGIKSNGTLWGWGTESYGELGDGIVNSVYSSPVQIGTLTNWSKVSTAAGTNYFINTTGAIYAAGRNQSGQLGDGTTVDKSSPVQIGTLTTWSKVSGGTYFAASIKTDGTLWMWGVNTYGQLGDGTTIDKSSPIQVGTLSNWSSVSCAGSNAVAIKTDGTLWAWGFNSDGQLGDGTTVTKSSPIQIGTLTTWTKVGSAGDHSVALRSNGTIWSWGANGSGQLGLGDITNRSSPTQIGTLTNWTDLSVLANSSIYARSYLKNNNNEVWVCGDNTAGSGIAPYSVLGVAIPSPVPVPIQVGTLTTWADIAAADVYAILKKTNGSLWSAGDNGFGQLGQGDVVANYTIRQVGTLTTWNKITATEGNAFAIKSDNTLWSWGANSSGQLGDGTTVEKSSPVQIGTLSNWSYIKTSSKFGGSSAIKTDGTLWAWGNNNDGQLGLGDTASRSSPVQVGTLTNWAYSFNAGQISMFVKTDNTLWACGQGTGGSSVGDGSTVSRSSPVQIGTGYSGLMAGTYNANGSYAAQKTDNTITSWGYGYQGPSDSNNVVPAYIILASVSSPVQIGTLTNWSTNSVKTDGTLWTWGNNGSGELGLGDLATRLSPTQVGTLSNWAIASTNQQGGITGAIKTDGTLWTWGTAGNGGLGNGSTTASRSSPAQVGTLTNWSKISAGNRFMVAVKTDGTLWAWGLNNSGQLGDGTATTRSSPVQIGTLTTWKDVFVSANNSYATKTDGTIWAWGIGTSGVLGNGTVTTVSSPVQIGTLTTWTSGVNFSGTAANGAGLTSS